MEPLQLEPCVELPLNGQLLKELVHKAKDWAIMHGAAMRPKKNFNPDSLTFAPFTLIPSTFPKREFEKAVKLQPILNTLVHRVAHDHAFLAETLKNTIKADEFTGKLYEIYETVRKEGVTQAVSLGLLRGDYLLDFPDDCAIKQVEINTVATSLSGLSTQFSLAHRFVLKELDRNDLLANLPENAAMSGLCEGMVAAWKQYAVPAAAILFVVEDITYNICDQRFHEFYIRETHPEIKVIRRSLTEINQLGVLDSEKRFRIEGIEVALVYFRSGYEPTQYHGEREWDARLLMERSLAIKCPSIHYHLAGTKKVQQELARPEVVERFLSDPKQVQAVREVFTGIYSLDRDGQGDAAAQLALENPERYVLKPQREGGGNNVYGAEVKTKMQEMLDSDERNGWILMERINPPIQKTYIIRPGTSLQASEMQCIVSELGVFGVILGDAENILVNEQCGHMLRTKLSSADEGGVAAGAGCLDSPYLSI